MLGFQFARSLHLVAWISSLALAGAAVADPIFYGVTGSTLVRLDMGAQTATAISPLTESGSPLT